MPTGACLNAIRHQIRIQINDIYMWQVLSIGHRLSVRSIKKERCNQDKSKKINQFKQFCFCGNLEITALFFLQYCKMN